ncbi:MAG: hypothetical protein U0174_22160 [Polyangiaceae bacterium]
MACAIGEGDVHRWEGTQHGPEKLVAVVAHDKYKPELRKEAAMSLVRMPARNGVRQGIKLLIDKHKNENGDEEEGALTGLPEEQRSKIIELMVPELIAGMNKPAPVPVEGQPTPADDTIPYKDVTFAMLAHEPPLVTNKDTKLKLEEALINWAQVGFEQRLENGSQQFGVEQMMRLLGARSVMKLPSLMTDSAYRVDRMAGLVADIGDAPTKLKAAESLVTIAKKVESPEWFEQQKKFVDEHNKKSNIKASPEQLQGQVVKLQDRKLNEELFPAMKRVGQPPVVDYLFTFAADPKRPEERRKLALAALEGKPDKNNPKDLERLYAIVKDESTPDSVKDIAFMRIGELPKEQILPKLYTLFEQPKKWKIRWVAASLVLKTISTKQIPEFMAKLPATSKSKMGMTEGLSYGQNIAKMEPPAGEPKPREAITPFLTSKSFGAKMAALGFFYEGKKADIPVLKPFEEDKEPLPKCDKEDDCQWACGVAKPGAAEKEMKDISTVGELVKLCIIPSMDK